MFGFGLGSIPPATTTHSREREAPFGLLFLYYQHFLCEKSFFLFLRGNVIPPNGADV